MQWTNHWKGYMREDPATLKVKWWLAHAPPGSPITTIEGECEDGMSAFREMTAAREAMLQAPAVEQMQELRNESDTVPVHDVDVADDPVPGSDPTEQEHAQHGAGGDPDLSSDPCA